MVIRRWLHLGAFALLLSGLGCDKGSPTAGAPDPTEPDPTEPDPTEPDPTEPDEAPNPKDAVGGADDGESGPVGDPAPRASTDGQACGDETCEAPATCVEYYGIAGASGPKFQSCEVRCKGPDDAGCPEGTRCVTVADGPGQVCR